jgi:hypothetical protein
MPAFCVCNMVSLSATWFLCLQHGFFIYVVVHETAKNCLVILQVLTVVMKCTKRLSVKSFSRDMMRNTKPGRATPSCNFRTLGYPPCQPKVFLYITCLSFCLSVCLSVCLIRCCVPSSPYAYDNWLGDMSLLYYNIYMPGQHEERKEHFKQYREKNEERLQQKLHDYYEQNKAKTKEYVHEWRQDGMNEMMAKVTKQEYYDKNKDIINAKCNELSTTPNNMNYMP